MTETVTRADHLKDLTPRQAAFVRRFVALGAQSGAGAKAVRESGYSKKAAPQKAYTLLADSKIQEAIYAETAQYRSQWGVLGMQTLVELAHRGKDEVRLRAAIELANRGGFNAIHRSEILHHHTVDDLSPAELEAKIHALLSKAQGAPIDAEFKVIEDKSTDSTAEPVADSPSRSSADTESQWPDGTPRTNWSGQPRHWTEARRAATNPSPSPPETDEDSKP